MTGRGLCTAAVLGPTSKGAWGRETKDGSRRPRAKQKFLRELADRSQGSGLRTNRGRGPGTGGLRGHRQLIARWHCCLRSVSSKAVSKSTPTASVRTFLRTDTTQPSWGAWALTEHSLFLRMVSVTSGAGNHCLMGRAGPQPCPPSLWWPRAALAPPSRAPAGLDIVLGVRALGQSGKNRGANVSGRNGEETPPPPRHCRWVSKEQGRQEAARLAVAQALHLVVRSVRGRGSSGCPSSAPSRVVCCWCARAGPGELHPRLCCRVWSRPRRRVQSRRRLKRRQRSPTLPGFGCAPCSPVFFGKQAPGETP